MSEASRDRTRLAGLVLCGLFVVMAGRGGYLALSGVPDKGEVKVAEVKPAALRASILDRNGTLLATNVETSSLFVNPSLVWDPEEIYNGLVKTFPDVASDNLREKLADKSLKFVWVKRGLTPNQRQGVMDLKLEGLGFRTEVRRFYPMNQLAGQVLGQVNPDGKGIAGIELASDKALKAGDEPVRLTLDVRAQTAVEMELATAAQDFEMAGAAAILMDTHTGEVLAMASWPSYDPNRPDDYLSTDPARMNRAIAAVYELGSVFKPLTLAAALDAGAVRPEQQFDVSQPIKLGRFEITDTHKFARSANLTEIIVESSNIGTVHVARELGSRRQKDFLTEAGLFSKAAIELPGSAKPIQPPQFDETAATTIAFGHGLAVSPLAFLSAFAALGNGGEMAEPTLILDPARKPEPKRLMSAITAETVTRMMRESVLRGSGKTADVPGYRVAGKTGTGEIAVNGAYDKNANISSFAAVFPEDGPQYALIVTLDNPQARAGRGATASASAAPVAGRIIERVAPLLGVTPRFDDQRPARTGQVDMSPERSNL
ncbi:MAG: penicillin-binding protein 2 [Acidobacteria bacterium]|nr:penicillin-binding protein 2 [Acidobacteriota bacterium]